ncbi:2-dehydro-3-deoxyglucarate aldolase, partial [Salmonella enterica subsp. enterica serovar Kentucky]
MNNAIFPTQCNAGLAAQQVQIGCWSALASPL